MVREDCFGAHPPRGGQHLQTVSLVGFERIPGFSFHEGTGNHTHHAASQHCPPQGSIVDAEVDHVSSADQQVVDLVGHLTTVASCGRERRRGGGMWRSSTARFLCGRTARSRTRVFRPAAREKSRARGRKTRASGTERRGSELGEESPGGPEGKPQRLRIYSVE